MGGHGGFWEGRGHSPLRPQHSSVLLPRPVLPGILASVAQRRSCWEPGRAHSAHGKTGKLSCKVSGEPLSSFPPTQTKPSHSGGNSFLKKNVLPLEIKIAPSPGGSQQLRKSVISPRPPLCAGRLHVHPLSVSVFVRRNYPDSVSFPLLAPVWGGFCSARTCGEPTPGPRRAFSSLPWTLCSETRPISLEESPKVSDVAHITTFRHLGLNSATSFQNHVGRQPSLRACLCVLSKYYSLE